MKWLIVLLLVVSCRKLMIEPKRCFYIDIVSVNVWYPEEHLVKTERVEKCNMTLGEATIWCNEQEGQVFGAWLQESVKIVGQGEVTNGAVK